MLSVDERTHGDTSVLNVTRSRVLFVVDIVLGHAFHHELFSFWLHVLLLLVKVVSKTIVYGLHVVTKEARFKNGLPSSANSS